LESDQQQLLLKDKFTELENQKKTKDQAEGFVLFLREDLRLAEVKYDLETKQFLSKQQEIKKVQDKLAELDSLILNEKKNTQENFEKEKAKIAESLYKEFNQKMEEEKVRIQAAMDALFQQKVKDLLAAKKPAPRKTVAFS
jgi:protein subunit release factor A